MQWKSIGVAKPLVDRIKQIYPMLGYKSVADFVDHAVRDYVLLKEMEYERILDKKVEERMNETVVQ